MLLSAPAAYYLTFAKTCKRGEPASALDCSILMPMCSYTQQSSTMKGDHRFPTLENQVINCD